MHIIYTLLNIALRRLFCTFDRLKQIGKGESEIKNKKIKMKKANKYTIAFQFRL
jgi:hypothetical protein